jgi:hypothetical protein
MLEIKRNREDTPITFYVKKNKEKQREASKLSMLINIFKN